MHLLVTHKFGRGNMEISNMMTFFDTIVGLIFFVNLVRFLYYYLKLLKLLRNNIADFEENVLANSQNLWSFINASNEEGVTNEKIEYLRIRVRETSRKALLFFIAFVIFSGFNS